MRFLLKLVLFLVVLVGIVAGLAYQQYQAFIQQPIQLPSNQPTSFEVKAGTNIRQVAQQLLAAEILPKTSVIPAEYLFLAQARFTEQASKLKAGEYALEPNMTTGDLLARLASGKTLQYQLGIIEGHTFKELVKAVQTHPNIKQTLSAEDYKNLMPKLGGASGESAEGWFYPDTYNFPRGSTDVDVLKRSYQVMYDYLMKAWEQREPHPLIKTPYQALILASLVEKETGMPDERPMIARVFLTRLERNMLLQTDPAVIYGMGDAYDGNIRKKDLETDTPWNTYTRTGLPPTPIATPSKAAIDAVMHPAKTNYLYFVATGTGDGRHFFSETYEAHRKAVNQYLANDKKRQQGTASQ
ncbi:endolytic transglycosylase MltG [uncultured Thiothrix sp.]|uniref:endolytic transglycosylase MltG n=1 Tax=uncultured Thiothrix sp. TaxID=223185 RepID=UPI00261A6505|nr:endolytic transglycosylase MltG [uncultured Thiothrix sp.]